MLSNTNNIIIISFIGFILFGCASVTQPTGGPRDETPPVLLLAEPTNETLNFKGNTITLTFDEYVELNNYQEQILVTPRLSEDFEAIVKRRSVILKLNEELKDSTTYTFNFRDAVEDITEGNPAVNLKLALSTGSYIDSAYIEGIVYDLKKQEPLESVMVGAYFADDTLNLVNQAPNYLTISDANGIFRLDNLKVGEYKLYALKDGNKNSMVDFKSEIYGFLKDTIRLDTSISNLSIPLLYNDKRELELTSARTSGKYYEIKYNKYVSSLEIEPLDDDSITYRFEENNTIAKFYNSIQSDSLEVLITAYDTLNFSTTDTVLLKFTESPRSPDPFSFQNKPNPQPLSTRNYKTILEFTKPAKVLEADSILVKRDSTLQIQIPIDSIVWNELRDKAELEINLDTLWSDSLKISDLKFSLGENAFISVESDSSTSFSAPITFTETDKTGIIEVEIDTPYEHFTVQLLDANFKLVREVSDRKKINFTYLPPGTYMIRALIDTNGDGSWHPGNILESIEPEPVVLFRTTDGNSTLTLKANWVLGPNVISYK